MPTLILHGVSHYLLDLCFGIFSLQAGYYLVDLSTLVQVSKLLYDFNHILVYATTTALLAIAHKVVCVVC